MVKKSHMYTQKGFHWFPLVSTKVDVTVNNFTVLYGKKSKSHTCIHMDNRSQFITQTVSMFMFRYFLYLWYQPPLAILQIFEF